MSPPTLLPSLARAIRGLSSLFWGLPIAVFLSANQALGTVTPGRHLQLPGVLGAILNTVSAVLPTLLAHGLLLYGLVLLRDFQPQERIWTAALERARLIAWLNLALVPFGYWFSRRPDEPLFGQAFLLSLFAELAFLIVLNHVVRRLAAMLPDETLRADVRLFTTLNIRVLAVLGVLLGVTLVVGYSRQTVALAGPVLGVLAKFEPWHFVVPALIPLALTMTLLWKTKEVIVASVFAPGVERQMNALPEPLIFHGDTSVVWKGSKFDYFGGCDYLRLARHPRTIHAAVDCANEFGLGVSASRLTTGNHPLYLQLEQDLRSFFGSEDAVLTSTGYSANLVTAQALAGRFTHALLDARAHPSLRDAARFLEADVREFGHRDPQSLRQSQSHLPAGARIILLTDGLFAHDGSVAPLDEYKRVLRQEAWMIVDDCHAAGILGRDGRGTLEFLGVGRKNVIQTITLSKAFGAQGGAVLADRRTTRAILERSHAFAGGTPPALPVIAAARTAMALVLEEPDRRARLARNTQRVKQRLQAAGRLEVVTPGPVLGLTPRRAEAGRLRRRLIDQGILPPWIRYPGGPPDGYFRFALSSEHTVDQLERLLSALAA